MPSDVFLQEAHRAEDAQLDEPVGLGYSLADDQAACNRGSACTVFVLSRVPLAANQAKQGSTRLKQQEMLCHHVCDLIV